MGGQRGGGGWVNGPVVNGEFSHVHRRGACQSDAPNVASRRNASAVVRDACVRGSASASAPASVRGGNDDDDDGRGATTTFGWRPSRESSREASREASQMRTAAGRREEVSSVIRRCVGRTRRDARMRTRAGFYPLIFFRSVRRVGGSSFLRSFVDGRRSRRRRRTRKVDRRRPRGGARLFRREIR